MQKVTLIICCTFISIAIFVFSYSYVDFNLTLNQNQFVLSAISLMQKLGFYNRPLASIIYIVLLLTSFAFFNINIILAIKKKIDSKYLFTVSLVLTLLTIFSYPFLSSDIFNYMFDSKIIVHYHQNPYTHKALDYPQDEWIRFMRWTHRYSPYGPLWLIYASIPAIVSFGKFIINFYLLKITIGLFHVVNTIIIYKILTKINPKASILGAGLYSLNPILILEGVVNAHNDVIIAALILLSFYFLISNKKVLSITSILLAASAKYFPLVIIPFALFKFFAKNVKVEQIIFFNLLVLTIFTFVYSTFKISVPFVPSGSVQVQFQPWYLFWTLPIAALLPSKKIILLTLAISFGASLRYLPFLYYGDWSHTITVPFMQIATLIPSLLLISFWGLQILITKHV